MEVTWPSTHRRCAITRPVILGQVKQHSARHVCRSSKLQASRSKLSNTGKESCCSNPFCFSLHILSNGLWPHSFIKVARFLSYNSQSCAARSWYYIYIWKRTQTACYTNILSLDRRIEMIKKRKIYQMKMYWSNSIGCLMSLENLLSAKPILRWREIPAQETKDGDSAKDDACLSNTSDEQVTNKKVKSDWRSWKWQRLQGRRRGKPWPKGVISNDPGEKYW